MKNLMKEKRGITLIALVITIIVLLILAGVAIATLTGDNGVITRVEEAKQTYKNAKIEEKIKLIYQEYQITKFTNKSFNIRNVLEENLEKEYGEDSINIWCIDGKNEPIIRVDINESNSYIMYDGKVEKNEEYTSESGTVYHKYEIYNSTNGIGIRYKNCENMIALECPNLKMRYPDNRVTENGLIGCEKLKAIKIPFAQSGGHYAFSGLPSLEYLELGSVGNAWKSGGYFMQDRYGYEGGYTSTNFGTPVGLTIVAYMNSYSNTAGFSPGLPALNTQIIIRSAETGEILQPDV